MNNSIFPASRLRGSNSQHSHDISADSDASETEVGDANENLAMRVELIDLDGEDALEPIDLTGDDFVQRYVPPTTDLTGHDSVDFAGKLQTGDCVECSHEGNDAFLRIVKLTKDHQGETYLHGDLLQRTGDVDEKFPKAGGFVPLHDLMPRTKNELCAILKLPEGASISLGKALATRHISQVGPVRNVIFTNKSHSELNGQTFAEYYRRDQWKEKQEKGTLFCRRKYIEEIDMRKKQVVSFQIRWIDPNECDLDCGVPVERIFDTFCPSIASSSARATPKRKRDVIDITSDDDQDDAGGRAHGGPNARHASEKKKKLHRSSTETVEFQNEDGTTEILTYKITEQLTTSKRSRGRKYIYADLCAGAGGTSTGAKMAGLKLKYLLDFDKDACKTLRLNFAGVAVLEMDISSFSEHDTSSATGGDHIEVMHISFPCQGHSTANRGVNPELDAVRIATAYGTLDKILNKCKPRVLTLEQVPGIMSKSDGQHFRAQVHDLTKADYSLRWKTFNFAQYGNPQARKRVIVIAAW